MRKISWVWLLSLVLLFAFSGLTLAAEETKEATQPVKVEEKGLLWVGGTPQVTARTQLDEYTEFLNETFDNGIPAEWSTVANGTTTVTWDTISAVGYGSNATFIGTTPPFAGIDSDAEGYVDVDSDLLSPVITIPANTYIECFLQYDASIRVLNGESATFSYTIDGGVTWVEGWTLTSTNNYDSRSFDILELLGAEGGTIQFKWNYVANYGYHMAIDNVLILGADEDYKGPEITILEAPSDLYAGWDAEFTAVFFDTSGVASADLHYLQWDDVNNVPLPTGYSGIIPMTVVNGDTMTATIAGDAHAFAIDDVVAFWFEATDSAPRANESRLPANDGAYYGYDIIDDTEHPDVEILTIPPYTFEGDDANFEFEITDDNGVSMATLHYTAFDTTEASFGPIDDGRAGTIDMMPGVEGVFTGVIAGDAGFVEGDFVGYYLEVADNWSTPNSAILPDTTDTGDPVYMTYEVLPEADILWDFEADQGDLESSDPSVWQYGMIAGADAGDYYGSPLPVPAGAFSGDYGWATVLDTVYANSSDGYLTTTVAWALDANAALRFAHWYHSEYCDGHNVQISLDLGETWTVMDPVEGYIDDEVYCLDRQPAYNNYNNAYWQLATFDLSAYEGEIVMFRIRFGSDSSVSKYGTAIDDFMLWGAMVPGELDGIVTDASDVPIEGASVTVYIADSDVEVARTETNRIGYYKLHPLPGTYDVVARNYGYLNAIAEDVVIAEEALTTADITMTSGVEEDTLKGTIWGDMEMTTPVSNVAVSVPSEYFNTFTGNDGTFNFGLVDHGAYTIVLSHVPAGYMGYHDLYLQDYEVTDRTLPLNLHMPEILVPTSIGATIGDGQVGLVWDAPADFFDEDQFEALPERLANLLERIEYVVNEGTEAEQAKLSYMQEDAFRMEQALLRHRAAELDQVTDFAGYRIMLNGTIWNDDPIEDTEILVDGLRNGLEYEIQVAADYGYNDDFLVWSDPIVVRPLPEPGYIVEETTYNWVELDPADGGVGTVWLDSGDDENTGLTDMGLSFNFYGTDYTQLAANSNGWLSFTDGTTEYGLELVIPHADEPNATLAPMCVDMDMLLAGDVFAVWSYLDATAGKFYVQYHGGHFWNTGDIYTFQLILDSNDNSIIYQYKTATSGWNVNDEVIGVENTNGTQGTVFNVDDIVDGMALRFSVEGGEKGNIQGNITSEDTGDPVEGVLVKATGVSGMSYSTISDVNGDYALLLLNKDDAPYDLLCRAEGYYNLEVDDVDWLESDDFVHYEDLVIDELDPNAPPRITRIEENFDDRFFVTLGDPGTLSEPAYLQYDDGTMANVYAWGGPPDPSWLAGTGFNVNGFGVEVLGLEVHCGIDNSSGTPYPDATHQDVVFNILDDNNGVPGNIIWSSEPVSVDEVTEWAVVAPNIPVPNEFYVMMSNPTPELGQEGTTVDESNEHGNYWYKSSSGWVHLTDASGDPLIRAMVSYIPDDGSVPLVEMVGPENPEDYESVKGELALVNNALNTPIYGLTQTRRIHPPIYDYATTSSSLDEVGDVLWYMVQYSLNGTDWTNVIVSGDTLISPANSRVPVVFTSNEENTEYMFRASAWLTDPDGLLDSLQSQWVEGVATFNCAPLAPSDLEAAVDGLDVTLTFTNPEYNEDGSELVDLAGCTAWSYDGETYTDLGSCDAAAEEISFTVGGTSLYAFVVTAFDEVPNASEYSMPVVVMAGEAGVSTSFEDGQWNNMATDAVWEHGAPTGGPGSASDGTNIWATYTAGNYEVDDHGILYTVEPITVTSENAMMVYDHWFEYEFSWDGYNIVVSTDEGESWVIVEPIGGYPNNDVDGIGDGIPGFTGVTTDWQTVYVPLGQFNGENIIIGFVHGSDDISVVYYGAAIDNLALYDATPPVYGSITSGTDYLSECTVDGDPIVGAEIWADGWPIALGLTGDDGTFDVPCPTGTWDIIFVHDDYWTKTVEGVVVTETPPVVIGVDDLVMTTPDPNVTPSSLNIDFNMSTMDAVTGNFTLENVGCGPMEYIAGVTIASNVNSVTPGQPAEVRETPDHAKARVAENAGPVVTATNLDDVWDLIYEYPDLQTDAIGAGDNMGIGMGTNHFYVAGFSFATLSKFAYDGTYVSTIDLPEEYHSTTTDYAGLNGLSYSPDGYLYGGNDDGKIYKFNEDFTDVEEFATVGFNAITVAYDYDANCVYVSNFGASFTKVDASGATSTLTPVASAYGMAYVPEDEDGYTIYAHIEVGTNTQVVRYNPTTNVWDMQPVATIYDISATSAYAGGMDAGVRSTGTLDIITLKQGDTVDRADLWEGYALQSWITLDNVGGTLLPGAQQQFTVTIDPASDSSYNPTPETQTTAYVTITGPHMDDQIVVVTIDWSSSAPEAADLPIEYALHQNYPNPFNPTTAIKFDLVEAQSVKLIVYNMLGQEVTRLVNTKMTAGFHTVTFDAASYASGVYFYRLETPAYTSMKKMVMIK